MTVIITNAYNKFEDDLSNTLAKHLTKEQLDKLNKFAGINSDENKERMYRPQITLIKQINQSLRPLEVQANVATFNLFKEYFHTFKNVIDTLKLTDQATEYLATLVQKSTTYQLSSFADRNKLYLYLLCYIKHQFYYRHDVMIDIFLKSTHTAVNSAKKQLNRLEKENRAERNKAIKKLSSANKGSRELIEKITATVKSPILSESGKVAKIEELVDLYNDQCNLLEKEHLLKLEQSLDKAISDQAYFDALESMSIKLQRKVAELTKHMTFNPATSSKELINAIQNFGASNGDLNQSPPVDFLTEDEKDALYKQDKLRTSFYKILLFSHMAEAIKAGYLNLLHSYRYKDIQEYLIDEQLWTEKPQELLEKAGLTDFYDFNTIISKYRTQLDSKYKLVNDRFLAGENIHLKIDKDGKIILHTSKTDSSDGRKVNVSVDSLRANYSYKYFGKGKGVSIYTFIDEHQLLFYSTVISASEREAAYVIDGLVQNDVVKSTIHSTDTHGFTETVFAVSPFINTAFAPRIKDIADQHIYSFAARQTYEKKGYKILPNRTINLKLIEKNWNAILRFMATIKLKESISILGLVNQKLFNYNDTLYG